jgi:hypothetical protein
MVDVGSADGAVLYGDRPDPMSRLDGSPVAARRPSPTITDHEENA